jgi:hypothetical protein
MALYLSGHPRIYFGAGFLTNSYERAQSPGCEACHKTGHGNLRDHDHCNAHDHDHETGTTLEAKGVAVTAISCCNSRPRYQKDSESRNQSHGQPEGRVGRLRLGKEGLATAGAVQVLVGHPIWEFPRACGHGDAGAVLVG